MRLDDALKGIKTIYIETAPLIYYVEANPAFVTKMDTIVNAIERTSIQAVTSVITLAEALTQPLKQGNTHLEQEYRDILMNSAGFRLLPITAGIAESAARLRARYNLRTPDALHIAAALDAQCDAFLTNDKGLQRVTEIAVWVLGELEYPPQES